MEERDVTATRAAARVAAVGRPRSNAAAPRAASPYTCNHEGGRVEGSISPCSRIRRGREAQARHLATPPLTSPVNVICKRRACAVDGRVVCRKLICQIRPQLNPVTARRAYEYYLEVRRSH